MDNIENEDILIEDVESVDFSAMRPFEAWMMPPSMGSCI